MESRQSRVGIWSIEHRNSTYTGRLPYLLAVEGPRPITGNQQSPDKKRWYLTVTLYAVYPGSNGILEWANSKQGDGLGAFERGMLILNSVWTISAGIYMYQVIMSFVDKESGIIKWHAVVRSNTEFRTKMVSSREMTADKSNDMTRANAMHAFLHGMKPQEDKIEAALPLTKGIKVQCWTEDSPEAWFVPQRSIAYATDIPTLSRLDDFNVAQMSHTSELDYAIGVDMEGIWYERSSYCPFDSKRAASTMRIHWFGVTIHASTTFRHKVGYRGSQISLHDLTLKSSNPAIYRSCPKSERWFQLIQSLLSTASSNCFLPSSAIL